MEVNLIVGNSLEGHLPCKNMILILFTRLVGLIGMLMGCIEIQVLIKRISQRFDGIIIWIWKWY